MSEQSAPTPVLCDACGKPCEGIPPGWRERPQEDHEPPTPIRVALHESCDQPGVASMIMIERMRRARLPWPPREEDEDAA